MSGAMDTAIGGAFRSLARAMERAHPRLRLAAKEGETTALLDLLRSGEPLGQAERFELAELLAGNLGIERGRRTSSISPAAFRAMAAALAERKVAMRASGNRIRVAMLEEAVANEHGIAVEQFRSWRARSKSRK